MKSCLFFFICLTIFHLTLSDSSNVELELKKNPNQLGNLMNIVFLRTDENRDGKQMNTPSEVQTSADDAERNTGSGVDDDKQSYRPQHKKNKSGHTDDDKKAVYRFIKEIQSEHQDKKAAQKIRDKSNVLKETKQKEYQNHEGYNKSHVRKEPKEKKEFKKRKIAYKKKIIKHDEEPDPILNLPIEPGKIAKEFYEIDPVLNMLRSDFNTRREAKEEKSDEITSSSSRELGNFREQFQNLWLQKKYEALNSTIPVGDQVNMGGARPWGVKCGDPNQHDMPWGTCMLAMECEAEYRIYRGDMYCGRTSFVCCALELTTYDMYQGFDISFEDKSFSTDSEELARERDKSRGDKKKRRDARIRRKKKIKQTIKNIIREINKILNKMYTNATKRRTKKTKQLKRFIKFLKTEYKKNRHVVQELHEEAMVKIDTELMKKLYDIKDMNKNFMKNQTFADIVVNGTMTKEGARMLIQAYPELQEFIDRPSDTSPSTPPIVRMADVRNRRFGGEVLNPKEKTDLKPKGDYLEYDVEYGFLYY